MSSRTLAPMQRAASATYAPATGLVLQRQCACGQHTLGGECEECKKKQMTLQRKAENGTALDTVPPIVHEVLRSPGQPLDQATRAFFEPRFGHDFSKVRLHTDAHAAESARAVNARAYTVGNHIVFAERHYAPQAEAGRRLLAHELAHAAQQQSGSENSELAIVDSFEHEREADLVAAAIHSEEPIPRLKPQCPGSVSRQKLGPDEPSRVERNFELDPQSFLVPMQAPAAKEEEKKCEEFPGGSTDCDVDATTGTPTGRVTQRIAETNACTKPCVEQHEAVHVKQMKALCPRLRDCYLAVDKGKGSALECAKMALFGSAKRECEAYTVSLPCVEKRLKGARECQSKETKEYGVRKLASEKCFRDKYC